MRHLPSHRYRINLDSQLRIASISAMLHPQTKISQLRVEIERHDALYYQQAQPEIDDQAYDRLQPVVARLAGERL